MPFTHSFFADLSSLLYDDLLFRTSDDVPDRPVPIDIGYLHAIPAIALPGEPIITAELIDEDEPEDLLDVLDELTAEYSHHEYDPQLGISVPVYVVPDEQLYAAA